MNETQSVVMLGATGAVGNRVAETLATHPDIESLTLLGRRPLADLSEKNTHQHTVDICDPATYRIHLRGHDAAICTLGVGQPSKVSNEEFLRIDQTAVLEFARECRSAGVRHFELLSSVGASAGSMSFYLRSKGQLEDALKELNFERLSLFRPSMILTPTNRYGVAQAITLKTWPIISVLLVGPLKNYRGIAVQQLGRALALNLFNDKPGSETLYWSDFVSLTY